MWLQEENSVDCLLCAPLNKNAISSKSQFIALEQLARGDGRGDAKSLAQKATNTADGLRSQFTPTPK